MRKLAGLAVSVMVLGLYVGVLTTPAAAQPPYPPGAVTCPISDRTLAPGEQFSVSGTGFLAGSTVTFTLEPGDIELGSTTVGADGTFGPIVLTIPSNIEPGPYRLVCAGFNARGNPVTRRQPIKVVGVVAGGAGPAFTGNTLSVPLWMALIAGLLAAGALLVVLGGRRRRSVRAGP